jgi:NADPH:quinone reductase-like Zn-dependent oxidoreductase
MVSIPDLLDRNFGFTSFDSGSVKPIVDSVFDFDDVPKAYERIMSKRATGKIVVKVT